MPATLKPIQGMTSQLNQIASSLGSQSFAPPKVVSFDDMYGDPNYGSGPPMKQIGGITAFGDTSYGFGGPMKQTPMDLNAPYASMQMQQPQQMGSMTSGGPGWEGVDQWSNAITSASQTYGVDPNLIRAVMKLESNGDPNASGAEGVWGPMQVNSNAWGSGPWMSDPVANINKGAEILKYYLDANNGNVREALRGYHGHGFDGYTTDTQYADTVLGNMQQLGSSGVTGGGSSSAGWTTAFGNAAVPDWGEFNVPSSNGLYDYGRLYGLNGTNHTGVDVPMSYGTQYRAPMSGTIVCSGTGQGSGVDGTGCAAFNDTIGNGAGRVELLLDNGAVLIFGHSATSSFRPGTHVNAGQVIGTSGGMNSPHIHLEARVKDPSTPTGWRIVDPRTVLGGGGTGAITGGGTQPYYETVAQQLRAFRNSQ